MTQEQSDLLKTSLSQGQLAEKFGISVAKIRDMEQSGQVSSGAVKGPNGRKRFTAAQAFRILQICKLSKNSGVYKPSKVGLVQKASGEVLEEPIYSFSELCKLCVRSQQSMLRWEAEGVIPKTTLIAGKRRYYTEHMIEPFKSYVRSAAGRRIQSDRIKSKIFAGISKYWEDLGYKDAKLVTQTNNQKGIPNGNQEEGISTEG